MLAQPRENYVAVGLIERKHENKKKHITEKSYVQQNPAQLNGDKHRARLSP